MAWKWYDIDSYKASVGGSSYYGGVQLFGNQFYASLKFHKEGPLPPASAPTRFGQRFYGHMDFLQLGATVEPSICWATRNRFASVGMTKIPIIFT